MSRRIITAIIDNKANDIIGQYLHVQRATATAVRMFQDAMTNPETMLHKHPEDFDLYQLGELTDEHTIEGPKELIITGKALKAALEASPTKTAQDTREIRRLTPQHGGL